MENKISFKKIIEKYLSFTKRYEILIILVIFLSVLGSLKGFLERYFLKIGINKGVDYLSNLISKEVLINWLILLLIFFIIITFLSAIFSFFEIKLLNKIEANMIYDIKTRFISHILKLDYKFFTGHKTGSLVSAIGRGAAAVERVTDALFFNFLGVFIELLIVFFSLLYLGKIFSFVMIFFTLIFISFSLVMQKRSNLLQDEANKQEDIEKGNVADNFTNVESIKYFGKENFVLNKIKELVAKTKEKQLKAWNVWSETTAGQILILSFWSLTILYLSFKKFIEGSINVGDLTFVYSTFLMFINPLFSLVYNVRNFMRGLVDFGELFSYEEITKEIKDKPNAKELKIKKGEIIFENVYFSYDNKKVFENFNLKIPPGKKVALVGHSGSGKTTLIKLLYRLYDIQKGSIKIDGVDIRNVKQESLRSAMSIVPQECILFDDTIYNNIKFSKPNASRKEVLNTIKFAKLDKFIASLPQKENTIVGERGIKLSGGEKQRVSIARALLANKKLLILDEATSSLDSETEHEIQEELKELMKNRTSIIIAHRLSTIMNADLIVVLKKGKIIQIGKHQDLINEEGEYKKLWALQKGGYIK